MDVTTRTQQDRGPRPRLRATTVAFGRSNPGKSRSLSAVGHRDARAPMKLSLPIYRMGGGVSLLTGQEELCLFGESSVSVMLSLFPLVTEESKGG